MLARVRPATTDDIPALTDVLVRAFAADPFMVWMAGTDDIGPAMRTLVPPQMSGYLRLGGLDVAHVGPVVVGGAMWAPPGTHLGLASQMRMARALGRPLSRHWRVVRRGFTALAKAQPPGPVWYLDTLAADPDVRGVHAGTALVEHRLAQADAQFLPVYLESSKQSNVPFYQRFGFHEYREVALPGGPVMYTMLREAREPDAAA